jgi:hypothetical protein
MEVTGPLHAPATLLPGNSPKVPIELEVLWAPKPVWTLWSKEKSVALGRNRTPAVYPVDRRYTD